MWRYLHDAILIEFVHTSGSLAIYVFVGTGRMRIVGRVSVRDPANR
jgi:hypothetical protein